eukprot:scaffold818_cov136-Cylindrotheca_fusiformis.AAC.26
MIVNDSSKEVATPDVFGEDDDDCISSLGDASPMNNAEKRQKRTQKRTLWRLLVFFGTAIFALVFSVMENRLTTYSQPVSDKSFSVGQNRAEMQELHVHHVASGMAHPFQPVSPSVWCIDARLKYEQAKRRPMGLCYLKMPRAASSTLSSVNQPVVDQRIARNFAKRNDLRKNCIRHDGSVPGTYYHTRDSLSFLWTFVRDPATRAMSRIGSSIRNNNYQPLGNYTDITLELLKNSDDLEMGTISAGRGGFQLQYSMLSIIEEGSAFNDSQPREVRDPRSVQHHVREILDGYNFIGVVERFDESLVALQLLLGLETSDILYYSVKEKNQFELSKGRQRFCLAPLDWNSLLSESVREHLESQEWFAQNYGDHILYNAANISLDMTILSLGLDVFSKALKDFRSLMAKAREICHPRLPCSSNGTLQYKESLEDCYAEYTACGYKCFDELSTGHKV